MIKNQVPKVQFEGVVKEGYLPKGCFLMVNGTWDGKVFFNTHPTGSRYQRGRHICGYQGIK